MVHVGDWNGKGGSTLNYLTLLNKQIRSYPSIIPRDFNLLRTLQHIPTVMPASKFIGGRATASKSEEVTRREVITGTDTVSLVNKNMFIADIEDPGRDSPLDVAITGEELIRQATEHNPDVTSWTVIQLGLVTPPMVSHENFDDVESVIRILKSHRTLGRSAGFTGVMNTYYDSKYLLEQMGLWSNDIMPAYRGKGVMKTHKILGRTSEGNNIGYGQLFAEAPSSPQESAAQLYLTEVTRRSSRLLDVGLPEPIITKTNGEYLLEQTGGIVFALMKNSKRIATILGADIPIYIFSS